MKKFTILIIILLILIVGFFSIKFLIKIYKPVGPGAQALSNLYVFKIKDNTYFDYIAGTVKWNANQPYERGITRQDIVGTLHTTPFREECEEIKNKYYITSFMGGIPKIYFSSIENIDETIPISTFVLFKANNVDEVWEKGSSTSKDKVSSVNRNFVITGPFVELYDCGEYITTYGWSPAGQIKKLYESYKDAEGFPPRDIKYDISRQQLKELFSRDISFEEFYEFIKNKTRNDPSFWQYHLNLWIDNNELSIKCEKII